jgi:hypothetical protein
LVSERGGDVGTWRLAVSPPMTYEQALKLPGCTEPLSVSEPTRGWLVEMVQEVIDREGVAALDGFEGDEIRAIFDGRFPPKPMRPGEK